MQISTREVIRSRSLRSSRRVPPTVGVWKTARERASAAYTFSSEGPRGPQVCSSGSAKSQWAWRRAERVLPTPAGPKHNPGFIQNTCKNRSQRFDVYGAAIKTGAGRNDSMRARQGQKNVRYLYRISGWQYCQRNMHRNSIHKSMSRLGATRKFLDGMRTGCGV